MSRNMRAAVDEVVTPVVAAVLCALAGTALYWLGTIQ